MSYRPDEQIFASDAKQGEVDNFPDLLRGWGITLETTGGKPPMEWFNDLFKRVDLAREFFYKTGVIAPHSQEYSEKIGGYPLGSIVSTEEGKKLFLSAKESNLSPTDDMTFWRSIFGKTPPQFDDSTDTATTEFVRRALGNLSGYKALLTNAKLTIDDVGKFIVLGLGVTATLPKPSDCPPGTTYYFRASYGGGYLTIDGGLPSFISMAGIAAPIPVALDNTGNGMVINRGDTWEVIGGSATLRYESMFLSSLTPNGYEFLPGGRIRQWGSYSPVPANSTVTIPYTIPFPNKVLAIQVSSNSNDTVSRPGIVTAYNISRTQIGIANSIGLAQSIWYEAIGH